MKRLSYFNTFVFLLLSVLLTAQPTLIYDNFDNVYDSRFLNQAELNNQFVFSYKDSIKQNIWITDGTTTTNLTQNINENNFGWLQATSSHLYFAEYDEEGTIALWKSDGTLNSHQKILDNVRLQQLQVFQDKLILIIKEQNDFNLWILDNDIPVKLMDDISPVFRFVEFNNDLYFASENHGLVKTDGTVAGTTIVRPYDPNNFYEVRLYTSQTTIFNGELYFRGCDTQHGCELWKTDGTTAGTYFVKELDATISENGSPNSSFSSMMVVDNNFYFYGQEGIQLYNSSQNIVTSLITFERFGRDGDVFYGASINNIPVFGIETYEKNGRELWTTNGTPEGTTMIKEINRSAADGLSAWSSSIVELNGHLYFQGNDGVFGSELWRTDGTNEGTKIVYDLAPRGASSFIDNMFPLGNRLYFTNRIYDDSEILPLQLWQFDLDNFTPQQPADYRDDNEWLSNIHSGYFQELSDFTTDKNHNAYVAIFDDTYFSNGSVFFEQDTVVERLANINTDDYKVTVAKISETNEFQWADIIYTNTNDYQQNIVIAADELENLYVAGLFEEKILIGDTEINHNSHNFFIAKYGFNGGLLWVRTGQMKWSELTQLTTNSKGEIFLTGIINELTYQGRSFGSSLNRGFVMKFNQSGDLFWLTEYQSNIRNTKMAFTPEEDIIFITSSRENIYMNKINKQGQKVWQRSFSKNERTNVYDVVVSPLGDIYFSGGYRDYLKIGEKVIFSEGNRNNGFLAKFNAFGENIYLKDDQNTFSEYLDIEFDEANNLYLLKNNRYEDSKYYERFERHRTYATSIIQKFDPNGQLLKEREILNIYSDVGRIALGSEGKIYYADMYREQLDSFANSIPRSGDINDIVFILHFSMDDKMETFETAYANNNFTISPNPMRNSCLIYAHDDNWQTYRLNIYGSNGQLLRNIEKNNESDVQNLRVSDLPTGVLIFQFDNGTERVTRKVVKH